MNIQSRLTGNIIYLSLGSNLGNKLQNLEAAQKLIGIQLGSIGSVSQVYESNSWGYFSENTFYNCCLSVTTTMDPGSLMEGIWSIERILGRVREGRGYADRLIDIDLLLYGNEVVDDPGLNVPHPKMEERRFVLEPLVEIAADMVHPLNGLTIREMLEKCQDPGKIMPV